MQHHDAGNGRGRPLHLHGFGRALQTDYIELAPHEIFGERTTLILLILRVSPPRLRLWPSTQPRFRNADTKVGPHVCSEP